MEEYKKTCLKVVKQNGLALQFVEHQDIDICLEAVNQNGMALKYVKDQRLGICIAAIKSHLFYEGDEIYDVGDKRRLRVIRSERMRDMCDRYSGYPNGERCKSFQKIMRRG